MKHDLKEIVAKSSGRRGDTYWWSCECGEEGGPCELVEFAWDAWVAHVRQDQIAAWLHLRRN